MAFPPLAPADLHALHAANAAIQRGEPAAAANATGALLARGVSHPDLHAIHGIACRRLGRLEDARTAFLAALALAPGHAGLWNSHANLLGDLGELDAALAAYDRALALDPRHLQSWINLGIIASRAGQHDRARRALDTALQLNPGSVDALLARASAETAAGCPEAALPPLQQVLAIDPASQTARHNLGVALRTLDRAEEALSELDGAIAAGATAPETLTTRAHVLADLGRFDEAVTAYRSTLAEQPGHLDAHETLARLLPQLGRADEALDSYRAALARLPDAPALWQSALTAARDLKQPQQLLDWSRAAEQAIGASPLTQIMAATALGLFGDPAAADAVLAPLVAADFAPALAHAAYWRLVVGDLEAAAVAAERAVALDPMSQPALAYLSVIWRLLDDPREAWLADYERLVMPIDLELPDRVLADLASVLNAMHRTAAHPADQSMRHGTQTRGNLFDRRHPVIQKLSAAIRQRVEDRLAMLQVDPRHPFLSRLTGGIGFAGSWSVRLRDQGFHVNHIHHNGWLSSALYVAVPPEIADPAALSDGSRPGALIFGVPDEAIAQALTPRRIEQAVPGKLVIFPSYFWHGTIPFRSALPRLTVAFDAVPV